MYVYVLERRRRWSDTYKGVPVSDDEDQDETDASVKEPTSKKAGKYLSLIKKINN